VDKSLTISTEEQCLAFLESGVKAIEEARDLQEVKQIRDQAVALRTYAKQQRASRDAQNIAAEVAIRAERRAGELLSVMEKNKGVVLHGKAEDGNYRRLHDETSEAPPTYADMGIHKIQAHRWQKAASVPEDVFEKHIKDTIDAKEELTSKSVLSLTKKPHVAHSTGQNEWYTPPEYIEAARAVMQGIDLDPASSAKANLTVKANTYYGIEQNGLSQKWFGNVWMNPPYSQPDITKFCAKMKESYESCDIDSACVLVNNATETGWFNDLLDAASAVCFVRGRVKFLDENGNPNGAPLQGQVILYIGANRLRFADYFSGFGKVLYV
jgi:phage N-6-adenine-methyltransferase